MTPTLLDVGIRFEQDIVLARARIRRAAALLGFDPNDQARMGAAVSEIARNALQHAGGGRLRAEIQRGERGPELAVVVEDQGPGMKAPREVLTGSGGGLLAARRLMGELEVDSTVGRGTRVRMVRRLPRGSVVPDPGKLRQIVGELSQEGQDDPEPQEVDEDRNEDDRK